MFQSIKEIRENSSILADLERDGKIKIVGAVYHVEDGRVSYCLLYTSDAADE